MHVQALCLSRSCVAAQPLLLRCHLSCRPSFAQRRVANVQIRTGKTKSVLNASSLPQGGLPPLPADDGEGEVSDRKYPPLLQQHLNNMRAFSDCVVLTRVGDFYEMYFDQVEKWAPLVNLKKARKPTALGDVPMAGFQHTQLERYLKMFVQDLGQQVALSEQIRLPEADRPVKNGGPLYERKVTRVITAGTLIDESFVDPFDNNFLLAIHFTSQLPAFPSNGQAREEYERERRKCKVGLSWVDLSSGDFFIQQADLTTLPSLIAHINPREIVLPPSMEADGHALLRNLIGDGSFSFQFHEDAGSMESISDWTSMLERAVPDDAQSQFSAAEVSAGNLVLDYVKGRLRDTQIQLQPPIRRTIDEYMAIDKQSLRNLEIRSTIRDGVSQGSLVHAFRKTVTKSGARLLTQRLVSPSTSLSVINDRLDLVQEMVNHDALREDITALLRRTSDTYRLLQKFSIGKGDADDLLGLARTIELMQQVQNILHEHIKSCSEASKASDLADQVLRPLPADLSFLWDIVARLDLKAPLKVARNIQEAIDEEGLNRKQLAEEASEADVGSMVDEVISADAAGATIPKLSRRKTSIETTSAAETQSVEDIWIMRRAASATLNRAHSDLDELVLARQALTLQLRASTKLESLTLRWSAGLGHFAHLKGKDARGSLSSLDGARSIRSTKTTVSFYHADWTHLGARIDDARLRIRAEEERFFRKLRSEVLENLMKLRRNAAVLDELDVACSSAEVAKQRGLIRPIVHGGTSHKIIGGRHPTVDIGLLGQGRSFTSNDCTVGARERIYLITGPNMAGKSTYLRQNALITILAQTGCFVPAEFAEIGLVDKMFSRVGSADNLYQDQSTFMVEMLETAEILKQATPRSFVIMDEVGRGTTPEDGVAVGFACLHHLQHVNKSRTLFATHFHDLCDMTQKFEGLGRYCTDVIEQDDGSWTYDHKLKKGVNRSSHALKVARLAGVPENAIDVAAEILAKRRANIYRADQ